MQTPALDAPTPEQSAAAVRILVSALVSLKPAVTVDAWEPRVRSAILASCAVIARLAEGGPTPAALTATSALGIAAADLLARTIVADDVVTLN